MIVRESIEFVKSDNPLRNMGIGLISKIKKITSDDLDLLKLYTDGYGKGHQDEKIIYEIYEDDSEYEIYSKRVKEVYKLLEPYEYFFGDTFETDMKGEIKNYIKSYLKNSKFNYVYDCGIGDEEVETFFCEIELPSANRIKVR